MNLFKNFKTTSEKVWDIENFNISKTYLFNDDIKDGLKVYETLTNHEYGNSLNSLVGFEICIAMDTTTDKIVESTIRPILEENDPCDTEPMKFVYDQGVLIELFNREKEKPYMYLVNVYEAHKKTENDWQEEFAIDRIRYPRMQNMTLEEYKKDIKKLKEHSHGYNEYMDEYKIMYIENRGYYTEHEIAENILRNNSTDLWETCYNYATIVKVPMNNIYPRFGTKDSGVEFYYYNEDIDGYLPVNEFDENKRDKKLEEVIKANAKISV